MRVSQPDYQKFVPKPIKFHKDPVRRKLQEERIGMAVALELPRMSGDPEVVAREIGLRIIAHACGYVYVASYVRHRRLPPLPASVPVRRRLLKARS